MKKSRLSLAANVGAEALDHRGKGGGRRADAMKDDHGRERAVAPGVVEVMIGDRRAGDAAREPAAVESAAGGPFDEREERHERRT
ncbi:MAG: hypothetical protein ABI134_27230 [Byssovorax sp.]